MERQEERRYEQQLAQIKLEVQNEAKNSGTMLSKQIAEFKEQLESEAQ